MRIRVGHRRHPRFVLQRERILWNRGDATRTGDCSTSSELLAQCHAALQHPLHINAVVVSPHLNIACGQNHVRVIRGANPVHQVNLKVRGCALDQPSTSIKGILQDPLRGLWSVPQSGLPITPPRLILHNRNFRHIAFKTSCTIPNKGWYRQAIFSYLRLRNSKSPLCAGWVLRPPHSLFDSC